MNQSFDELLATADDLLKERERDRALPVLEAAMAAARTLGEKALTLHRMAWMRFDPDDKSVFAGLLEQAIPLAEAHLQSDPEDSRAALALAESWHDKANFTFSAAQEAEEIALIGVLLDRFLETAIRAPRDLYDRHLRRVVARALRHKASHLAFTHSRESVAVYDDLLRRFQDIDDPWLWPIVAAGAVWRALELATLGRTDEQIAAYDDVIARYDHVDDRHMREIVLDARTQRLLAHIKREDFTAAVEACDELLTHYADSTSYQMVDAIARTLISKGDALDKLGKLEQALACYDRVIETWASDKDKWLRMHAADALLAKGVSLGEAGQGAAEIACYDELQRRYAKDEDKLVRAVAAHALVFKGLCLRAAAADAAKATGAPETEAEIACYDQVIDRFGGENWVRSRRAVAEALLHKGESLLETGRATEAAACFDAIEELSARRIYDPLLEDVLEDARALRAKC